MLSTIEPLNTTSYRVQNVRFFNQTVKLREALFVLVLLLPMYCKSINNKVEYTASARHGRVEIEQRTNGNSLF